MNWVLSNWATWLPWLAMVGLAAVIIRMRGAAAEDEAKAALWAEVEACLRRVIGVVAALAHNALQAVTEDEVYAVASWYYDRLVTAIPAVAGIVSRETFQAWAWDSWCSLVADWNKEGPLVMRIYLAAREQ